MVSTIHSAEILLNDLFRWLGMSLPMFCYIWQAIHTAPVRSMAFDSTSTLLATGGADSTVKVWDVVRQYCTNNLRQHRGVVRSPFQISS